ncbi:hypothetical protein [Lutispora saccharofermentans]|nr:hypothetical protein [Lutispora saccharofermentans]
MENRGNWVLAKFTPCDLYEALPADSGDFRLISVKPIEVGAF